MKRITLGLFIALVLAVTPLSLQINVSKPEALSSVMPMSLVESTAMAAAPCPDGVQLSVAIDKNGPTCLQGNDVIIQYVKIIAKFLTYGIGLVIVLMIVIAGIQYITANGQPANVAKAKDRIKNAITALILFAASAAILNFLIP